MLIWCSRCLGFICEGYPYDKLFVSYGICPRCGQGAAALTAPDLRVREVVMDIYARLTDAGRRNDLEAAEAIIDESIKQGIKPIDILLGIIAPILYQAGEDWERGTFTVSEEHRLTSFCESVVTSISTKSGFVAQSQEAQNDRTKVLLMNAPGNTHTIALKILALRLMSDGVRTLTVEMPTRAEDVAALLDRTSAERILISMALPEQSEGVVAFARYVAEVPETRRPRIIVGGNAVKNGSVAAIPGVDLIADIGLL